MRVQVEEEKTISIDMDILTPVAPVATVLSSLFAENPPLGMAGREWYDDASPLPCSDCGGVEGGICVDDRYDRNKLPLEDLPE